jgi:hypothetical protein
MQRSVNPPEFSGEKWATFASFRLLAEAVVVSALQLAAVRKRQTPSQTGSAGHVSTFPPNLGRRK